MPNNYLFYISQNYSFEILRPIQAEIIARGDSCAWYVEGSEVNSNNFEKREIRLKRIKEIIEYNPIAVFVPGNHVPNFIPGLKVQVFHGLEWKKKGHFKIRGFFDLYCTHGKITTSRFDVLAKNHGHFHVKETGWSKLDPLFQTPPIPLETDLPVVLFAPTFSPNLTCALECLDEITRIAKKNQQYWVVKFHPKMNKDWIELYRQIDLNNFQIIDTDSCLPLLQRADVLLSDTSSIISEFLLLNKPVITYKNAKPEKHLIDIRSPEKLEITIEKTLKEPRRLIQQIRSENINLHPYKDGKSSHRILKTVDELIANPIKLEKNKPINFLRNFKLRRKLNYWKW